MLFVVHALDRRDGLETRKKHFREHRAHLDRAESEGIRIMSAGSLVAQDGETPIGSLFIVEAANQATVDAFCRVDPYRTGEVWESVHVAPYVNRRGWASHTPPST